MVVMECYISIYKMMCLKTLIYTKLFGKLVGCDRFNNSYYESKDRRWFGSKNRWVIYGHKNKVIANIEPLWFQWLYYMSDVLPFKRQKSHSWMIECGVSEYDKQKSTQVKNVYDGQHTIWNGKYE